MNEIRDPDDDPSVADPGPSDEVPVVLRGLARSRASIARPMTEWYVAMPSNELGGRPAKVSIFGMPIVLFRDGRGRAAALLDRCPHRNVPLSHGSVEDGELRCAYHGWRFDGQGGCRAIPSRLVDDHVRSHDATSFPVVETDGFVWVYPSTTTPPAREPYRFQYADDPRYTVVRHSVEAEASLHAAVENALDVPHTQFLHRGLFRAESRGITITANVRRYDDRVEAEYVGEPRPVGLFAKILSPSGGLVRHVDRFVLPCIAEVEYAIGDENHFFVATAMTPIDDYRTRIHAVVSVRSRIPTALVTPILKPLALEIFRQDAAMLATQTETIRRFGGERFASTEIDVIGKHVARLLRTAERNPGPRSGTLVSEESVSLVV